MFAGCQDAVLSRHYQDRYHHPPNIVTESLYLYLQGPGAQPQQLGRVHELRHLRLQLRRQAARPAQPPARRRHDRAAGGARRGEAGAGRGHHDKVYPHTRLELQSDHQQSCAITVSWCLLELSLLRHYAKWPLTNGK